MEHAERNVKCLTAWVVATLDWDTKAISGADRRFGAAIVPQTAFPIVAFYLHRLRESVVRRAARRCHPTRRTLMESLKHLLVTVNRIQLPRANRTLCLCVSLSLYLFSLYDRLKIAPRVRRPLSNFPPACAHSSLI